MNEDQELNLFENHQQEEGGSEIEPAAEPAEDTKEAQPSLEEAVTGGRTGTITGGATDGGGTSVPAGDTGE